MNRLLLLTACAALSLGARCSGECSRDSVEAQWLAVQAGVALACDPEYASETDCERARHNAHAKMCALAARCGVKDARCSP